MTSVNSTGINSASFGRSAVETTLDKQMQPVAELFDMSLSDVKAQLRKGQTLADIAVTKKVSEEDLESTIAKALQDNAPAGGTALSDAQAANLATAIATGKTPTNTLNLSSKTLMDYINDN